MTIPKKTRNASNGFLPPPILLDRPEPKELEKDQYMTFKLKTDPGNRNSAEYSLSVPYFRDGSPEEWLKFVMNLKRLFEGQNITTGPLKFSMARKLLIGESLSLFEEKASTVGAETLDQFDVCLRAVTNKVFPMKAINTQNRYTKKILRKPKDMRIRDFLARFKELNKYLEEFPPYNANQELPEDEIILILESAIPSKWQQQMVLQGFEVVDKTIQEFIEFCERLEFSEQVYDSTHAGQKATVKNDNKTKSGSKASAGSSNKKKEN